MAKKRLVARKVGEVYELTPPLVEQTLIRAGWTVGGGLLALAGLRQRSWPGALLGMVGGGMAYYGITGRNPIEQVIRLLHLRSAEDATLTPSYQHDWQHRATQVPADEVEEASMESFPASDAPGH